MEKLVKAGSILYGLAMALVGFHQLFYGKFCVMIVPRWPVDNAVYTVLAYVGSLALMAAGLAIVFDRRAREAALWLGGGLLVLLVFSYVPYELLHDPNHRHIAMWTNAFKELAFAGGAFVVAGTYTVTAPYRSPVLRFLEKLIPAGRWFFAITMTTFGCMHWLYLEPIANSLVPAWIPYHVFWTGFTGICLIGAGLGIALNIKTRIIANLLGLMIMLWFFMIHVPRALATPFQDEGNEVTAAFSALAFCGTALVIANAYGWRRRPAD